jgi:hypothetical protein
MADPHDPDCSDEIGEIDMDEIAQIIARFCPDCSPEEIMRRVRDVVTLKRKSGDPD